MADYAVPTTTDESSAGTIWAFGTIFFGSMMMLMLGMFDFFQGLAALFRKGFYVIAPNYAFAVDVTTWGWIHMFLGILVAAAGIYLLLGKMWARIIGVIVALVSAVWNFQSIPYYPIWSILIIALDILAIWAITFHGRELKQAMSND